VYTLNKAIFSTIPTSLGQPFIEWNDPKGQRKETFNGEINELALYIL